jgi:hypothetical protein
MFQFLAQIVPALAVVGMACQRMWQPLMQRFRHKQQQQSPVKSCCAHKEEHIQVALSKK